MSSLGQRRRGNSAPVSVVVPHYAQTLDFTCGPSSLLMVMKALEPGSAFDRSLELRLWKEATTMFMGGPHHGGSSALGLALAADRRGFDAERGWMHTVAHTADVLKYLVHNPRLGAGGDVRLLAAVREKIEGHDAVFTWGENDRIARALHAAVRRGDADRAALESWTAHWVAANERLWAGGPHVEPARYARVENAKQVMRSLFVALTLDAEPTPAGQDAAKVVRAALVKLR